MENIIDIQTNEIHQADEEVIARVLSGQKSEFETIMRKYNRRLYRISMSIVGDGVEAEDILQTSYLKAYEHLSEFQFRSGFGTWLVRIVINESLQMLRKRKHIVDFEMEEETGTTNTEPLKDILQSELHSSLEDALAELPEKYRVVFIMKEVEDMSTTETMESLNISESNVRVRLSRAKEMLRDSLTRRYKTEELYGFHLTRCNRVVQNVLSYIENS